MRYITISFCFMIMSHVLPGQLNTDFSSGTLTENPAWTGDLERFVIDNQMLRLADDQAGQAWLSTPSFMIDDTQWDFWIRLSFVPSSNNHPRIYLVSDQPDLTESLHGYFIQAGQTGSDNKRLYLYRQDGEEIVSILEGRDNILTQSNNRVRVRVIRDKEGLWQLFADAGGDHAFLPQGEVVDNTHQHTSWFGLYCRYTASNSRGFYFTDLCVGVIIPEPPPQVTRVRVHSQASVDVYFNRVVTQASASNIKAYFVDDGIGHPLLAVRDPENPLMVRLLFQEHLRENQLYTLSVEGVMGIGNELMIPYTATLVYYVSRRFDLVFNELMVNSRPPVGLPPHDWLELYNTTDLPINIDKWQLAYGANVRQLPDADIPPGGYLVLTTENALPEFGDLPHFAAVMGLSENALTIGGSQLVLYDPQGKVISYVAYDDSWYGDQSRSSGGWSLEKIDPYNFCQGRENWRASTHPLGGTPGTVNSVMGANPDKTTPWPKRVSLKDNQTLLLHFSGPMDDKLLRDPGRFTLDGGLGHPVRAIPQQPCFSTVQLDLGQPLEMGVIYTLQVCETLVSCAGIQLESRPVRAGLPESPERNDLIINEILFNPPPYGARYVELYNRSDRILDVTDVILASADTLSGMLETLREIEYDSFLLFPDDFLVLSADPDAVMRTFTSPGPGSFARVPAMPRMTNAGGSLVLATRGFKVLDSLTFSENMHLPMLSHTRGVALERVNPGWPSTDFANWHSAASNRGFGTPGMRNSQYLAFSPGSSGVFEVNPEIFVPDGSGHDDLLVISYHMDEPGFIANVRVFDLNGQEVRTLSRGISLGTSGVITWDGATNNGLKASVGIYVIHIDVFNEKGSMFSRKLTAVLGARLQ